MKFFFLINTKTKIAYFIIPFSGLLVWLGWHVFFKPKPDTELSNVFRQYDTLVEFTPARANYLLDSAYRANAATNAFDKANYFTRKYKYCYDANKDFRTAYLFVDSAIQLLQKNTGDKKLVEMYVEALNDKGFLLRKENNYEAALKYYLIADKVFKRYIADTCAALGSPSAIGDLFYSTRNYKNAIRYYLDDYRRHVSCDGRQFQNFFAIEKILLSVGICYTNLDMYDSAYIYLDSSLRFVRTRQKDYDMRRQPNFPLIAEAVITGFMANVIAKRGDAAMAEPMFMGSMAISRTADVEFYASQLAQLTEMYIKQRQTGKAMQTFKSLDSLLNRYPLPETRITYHKLQLLFDETSKNYEGYLRDAALYESAVDSFNASVKNFRHLDLQREFAINQQMGINETLEEKNKGKNNIIILGLFAIILVLTIAFLSWKDVTRNRKRAASLANLNNLLAGKNRELEEASIELREIIGNNKRIVNIMAHDLRSPLSGMQLLFYSIGKKQNPFISKHLATRMGVFCQYMLSIIKVLLKKEIDADTDLLSFTRINFGSLIKSIISGLGKKVTDKNISITAVPADINVVDNLPKMKLLLTSFLLPLIESADPNESIEIVAEKYNGENIILLLNTARVNLGKNFAESLSPAGNKSGITHFKGYKYFQHIAWQTIKENRGRLLLEDGFGYGCISLIRLANTSLYVYTCY
ncbi:HAMP domain-containing histidine kinase [Foetidibacter luteolus]|uniref:HAMP domain-containing histidine kinase n=1 Tax=Foetidibacter luteolus TaxID=2608880 RepID=UPI00129AFA1B|nr:HAMP domain-containing histidine kinase [Foetidibacter luteolus]